jgi:Rrf2 family protein
VRASQQLKYAIYGVFDLAYHGRNRPVSLQEIGERQLIPARYLEQIFQRLRRAGLVQSKRGPGGGYLLARAAEQISLSDVVRATQGGVLSVSASESGAGCPEFVWGTLREALDEVLGRRTIADLCREAAARGIERASPEPPMYEI